MKRKLFTFLVAFLATLSGAVWGQQNGSPEVPITIDIRGLTAVGGSAPTGNGFIAKKGLTNGSAPAPYSNTVEIIEGGYSRDGIKCTNISNSYRSGIYYITCGVTY